MGFYFKIVSQASLDTIVNFISKKIIKFVSDTQKKIDNIKQFSDAFEGAQFYSSMELFGFSYFITTKILMANFKDKDKAKDILTSSFKRYVAYLSKYKELDMSADAFLHYVDARFANICNDFERQAIDVTKKNELAQIVAEKIAKIYNKDENNVLESYIAHLYKKIYDLLT